MAEKKFTKRKLHEIYWIRHAFGKVFFGTKRLCLLYICSVFKGIRNPSFTDNES